MNIHKTAILEKSVSVGKNVEIGPFSQILGNVQIGDNVKIKSNCVIGAEADQPRAERLGDQSGNIIIENDCVIKDSVIISKPTLTEITKIGSHSYLMSGAYIAHDSVLGKNVIISHCPCPLLVMVLVIVLCCLAAIVTYLSTTLGKIVKFLKTTLEN